MDGNEDDIPFAEEEDIENGQFHIFDEDGELNVEAQRHYILSQSVVVDGKRYFPAQYFDSLVLCEIYRMLKQLSKNADNLDGKSEQGYTPHNK